MRRVTWTDRFRYAFDNTFSRGPIALIAWLGLLSLALILVAAVIVTLTRAAPEGEAGLAFHEAFWMSLMRTLDPGTMGGDTGWGFRIVMLGVTFGGIFVISTLIGVLTSGIEGKLEEMRKGRSHVIEQGHTVILGWSDQIFTIVSEIVLANANQPRSCIAVLAERDKVEMEDAFRDRVGATGRTRLVCRSGLPMDMADLDLVSLGTSRAIIILSPGGDSPDADVIKAILAITNNPQRRPEPYHIVAEIRDPRNMGVAQMVGRDEIELVLVGHLISRMIAQTCRQSGLSVVYNELLDFGGDEIYFKEESSLVGKTFGEALSAYEDSTVIGIQSPGGGPRLNPPMETRLQSGDRLIVIADDDDTIHVSHRAELPIDRRATRRPRRSPRHPESTLILGWNWRGPAILHELEHYVPRGSKVRVVADRGDPARDLARHGPRLANQKVRIDVADTTDRSALDGLSVHTYDHVIVLAYDGLGAQEADARTLVTLLHLRDIADRKGIDLSIVSEMLDVRNRQLAEVTRADDFIVSDRIVSLMLAQVSENKALNAVFADIFDPEGSEIYLKPAADFVALEAAVTFYTVIESARQRGEVAIGYRLAGQAGRAETSYGVRINPIKSEEVRFGANDLVIVVSED
jgi:voltage-gated potassium channel Kch